MLNNNSKYVEIKTLNTVLFGTNNHVGQHSLSLPLGISGQPNQGTDILGSTNLKMFLKCYYHIFLLIGIILKERNLMY